MKLERRSVSKPCFRSHFFSFNHDKWVCFVVVIAHRYILADIVCPCVSITYVNIVAFLATNYITIKLSTDYTLFPFRPSTWLLRAQRKPCPLDRKTSSRSSYGAFCIIFPAVGRCSESRRLVIYVFPAGSLIVGGGVFCRSRIAVRNPFQSPPPVAGSVFNFSQSPKFWDKSYFK